MDRGSRIPDDEAAELWRRAAELQAAAERADQSRHALVPHDGQGLTLEQVSAAAEGAGIEPDHVRVALAERRLPDADKIRRDQWTARWVRLLITDGDAFDVLQSIASPPQRVLEALRAVASSPQFPMALEKTMGDDPVKDGVLVYRILGTPDSSFHSDLDIADARVVLITIRPERDGTRLRLRVPLFRRGINLALAGTCAGLASAGGWSAGGALGAALGGLIGASTAVIALPAAIGAGAGALVGVRVYRRIYGWAFRKGESALHRLVQAIILEVGRAGSALGGPESVAHAALPAGGVTSQADQ
ncbi:MAG: hypothetical protein ACREMQ_18260 [Longimicrobiales bacterium]